MFHCEVVVTVLICLLSCGSGDQQDRTPTVGASSQDRGFLGSLDLRDPELYLVDLREPRAFARRHVRGSINLQWDLGQFEERVERLFPAGARLVIYHPEVDRVNGALAATRKAGFEEARGFAVDPADMELSDELAVSQPILGSEDLRRAVRDENLLVLDVRTSAEYARGHIAGAVFVYPDDIGRLAPALRKDRPLAVICAGGWRSSLVASWLLREGMETAFNAIGGMQEWESLGYPVEKGSDQVAFR